ncbi:alternative ribosome rescue aminoacyl-tRNA hydrolase ArfB [Marinactinospora rubrisoli]|uniref:Alternative ribosome rescue aminoacyl-tRNA hydrolase ArfB n=1 Tax=Marinactinospora rubrisoli TaxID=2715399 RepID=A0ABW2KEM0_9ACTN
MTGGARDSRRVPIAIPEDELRWRFSRSSGPGGQHVNTSDTRVTVSFDVAASAALRPEQRERVLRRLAGRLADGVLAVTAQEHRSQTRNRETARQRLTEIVSEAAAPGPRTRRPTRPTRASRERRLAAKRRRSDVKRTRSRNADD